jgi:transposase-like protein
VAKRRVGRYSNEFRRLCVERMKQCDDLVALAKELDVHRRLLYRWRDQLDPVDKGEWPPPQNYLNLRDFGQGRFYLRCRGG